MWYCVYACSSCSARDSPALHLRNTHKGREMQKEGEKQEGEPCMCRAPNQRPSTETMIRKSALAAQRTMMMLDTGGATATHPRLIQGRWVGARVSLCCSFTAVTAHHHCQLLLPPPLSAPGSSAQAPCPGPWPQTR
jgi:hypothetical protein